MNMLELAYMGDAVYEVKIREYLISTGLCKVNDLQKEAVKYVSANSQSMYLKKMIDENFLSSEELNVVTCARNHKNNHKPKYTDIITYKNATGLEALIGQLYFDKNNDRINEIIDFITGENYGN